MFMTEPKNDVLYFIMLGEVQTAAEERIAIEQLPESLHNSMRF
jgi:hypothetical protein